MKDQYEDVSFTANLADYENENLLLQNLINAELVGDYEISANLNSAEADNVFIPYVLNPPEHFSADDMGSSLENETVEFETEKTFLDALDSLHSFDGDISVANRKLKANKGAGKKNTANKNLIDTSEGLSENEIKKIDKKLNYETVHNPWEKERKSTAQGVEVEVYDASKELQLKNPASATPFAEDYGKMISEPSFTEMIDEITDTMPADNFIEWEQRWNAKVDATLEVTARAMDTTATALDMSEKMVRVAEKVGFFPQMAGALGDTVGAIGGASAEIARTLRMDKGELAMKRFESGDQQQALASPGFSTGVVYPDFVNNQVGDIVTSMDAFTNKFICYFANSATNEIVKLDNTKDGESYPYYYYIDDISIKPVKKSTTELRYGAFKTQVALLKPEGKNEFEFSISNDISLKFWQIVRYYGLGVNDSTSLYTSYATDFGKLKGSGDLIDFHILVPSYSTKGNHRVQRFVCRFVRFSNVPDLPFSHKEGQLKSKIKGICRNLIWYPNSDLKSSKEESSQ